MWSCNYFANFPWIGGFSTGGIFPLLIWGLIILALIYLALKLFGLIKSDKTGQNRDEKDSIEILKMRYAKGEFTQEQYTKMKDALLRT